jgi:hypothetical protein
MKTKSENEMGCLKNPYVVCGEKPKLQNSVTAFVDILGFKELIKKNFKDDKVKAQKLLEKIHCALIESRQHIDPQYANIFDREKDFSAFSAFTDNIVMGYPISFFGQEELMQAFRELSRFQMRLAIDGFFVRGGISIDVLYMDNIVVYGPALLEAYEAENNFAVNPRIVLTSSAIQKIKEQLEYYPLKDEETPHIDNICLDADGQHFVDYLKAVTWDDGYFTINDLKKHKLAIEHKIKEHKGEPQIDRRYRWVAQYHNEFCDSCGKFAHLKINIDNYGRPIRGSIV